MSRAVAEWIGKTDDEAIPGRVKVRVFAAAEGRCASCGHPIIGKRPEYDHIVALINGGENRETNIQPLCHSCHGRKTKRDVAVKSKTYRMKAKQLGIKKPRTITRWRKFSGAVVIAPRER